MIKNHNFNTGFTLLETLAALTVLVFGILGPLNLASYSLRSAGTSENSLVAFHLAQEAMEYIRNKRDTNALKGESNWLDGMAQSGGNGNPCGQSNGCYVDIPNNDIVKCSGSGCPSLRYNATTGLYSYNASDPVSIFTRTVRLARVSDYEENVNITVSWQDRFGTKSFIVEENFFDWP